MQVSLITQADFEQFKNDLRLIIREEISLFFQQKQGDFSGLVTDSEARKLIQKGRTWLYQKRVSGKLAFQIMGKSIYYKVEDLLKLAEEGKV